VSPADHDVTDGTNGTTGEDASDEDTTLVDRIAELAQDRGTRIAVAESLTAGQISGQLGQGEGASEWYRGAVVSYDAEVKFDVLGVTRGPVVTDRCAREMAEGVRRLLKADLALAITGVGGPGPDEGRPAGTVHMAVTTESGTRSREAHLPGEPGEVVAAATRLALEELVEALQQDAAAEPS
jgi:nicotinamide-nucleotide amidase